MDKSGEQWTPMRAAVFDALASFDRPASAYDIADKVSTDQGRRVAANSVYRILDLFVGANLARRVESANAYLANDHPGCLHDCIFLICDNCGQATHIDDDRLTGARARRRPRRPASPPMRPVIEVRGLCGDCAAELSASHANCSRMPHCRVHRQARRRGVSAGRMTDRPETPLLDTVDTPARPAQARARRSCASSPTSCAPR